MSKIRYFSNGKYVYFEHCPFCGSVEVDFDRETFHCPDCGAVVSFDLPERESYCDGPSESDLIVQLWNNRRIDEITADDLCVTAQKAKKEMLVTYQRYVKEQVWSYITQSATLGKFECEISARYIDDPDSYREMKFDVEKKDNNYIISWNKDIQWD